MSLNLAAQHLASKGRHGDDSLVHVSKSELAGLQALAKRHGKSLTKNPETGLPEAFGLKQLLPMAAGAALTPFVGPMGAAAIVGGLGYMQSGSLTQGLMAGMGAYGGAGLMGGATAAGTQEVAGQKLAEEAAKNQAENAVAQQAATVEATNAAQAANLGAPGVYAPPSTSTTGMFDEAARDVVSNSADMSYITPANQIPPSTYSATANADQLAAVKANTGTYELAGKGISNLGTESGRDAFVRGLAPNGTGTGYDVAKYGMSAAAPIIADKMTPDAYVPPEIKSDTDMGQRYAYDSGYSNDIPGRTGPAAYKAVSDEEAKKLYGFADGGEIQYPMGEAVVRMAKGGSSGYTGNVGDYSEADVSAARNGFGFGIDYSGYDTAPNINQGIATVAPKAAAGTNPNQNIVDLYAKVEAKRIADEARAAEEKRIADAAAAAAVPDYANVGYGYGGGAQGGLMPDNLRYAKGGETSSDSIYSPGIDYSGYDTPANQGIVAIAPQAASGSNPNQRIVDLYKQADARRAAGEADGSSSLYGGLTVQKGNMFPALLGAKMVGYDASGNPVYAGGAWDPMAYKPDENGVYGPGTVQYSMQNGTFMNQTQPTYAAQGGLMDSYAQGGISTLGSYSDGGRLLKGPGDGMSDNIPAKIGAKQPARLADGEFVVPADVVSHLGNGSTDAGAKQLYKMMDRIRAARTGRKAQGKQVNPNKFMPA